MTSSLETVYNHFKTLMHQHFPYFSEVVNTSDIVDNLTTNDATKVLSAKQGKVLYDAIAGIENDMLS